jgi:hypothetical protein
MQMYFIQEGIVEQIALATNWIPRKKVEEDGI